MRLRQWIAPRDRPFFEALEEAIVNAAQAADVLVSLFSDFGALAEQRRRLKDLEHRGDQLTHTLFHRLGRRGAGILTRDDVARLAKGVDDIVDGLYDACNRLYLYEITKPTVEMVKFASLLQRQTRELDAGLRQLRRRETMADANKHCLEVNRLEAEADRLHDDAVAALFRGSDPILILKHSQVYEVLEAATDSCEGVADVLSDIVHHHTKRRSS